MDEVALSSCPDERPKTSTQEVWSRPTHVYPSHAASVVSKGAAYHGSAAFLPATAAPGRGTAVAQSLERAPMARCGAGTAMR